MATKYFRLFLLISAFLLSGALSLRAVPDPESMPDTIQDYVHVWAQTHTGGGGAGGSSLNGVGPPTGTCPPGTLYTNNSNGNLYSCSGGTWSLVNGSASSLAFSSLTSATNSTAAMVVGTGSSLGVSGTGTIGATTLLGATWASPAAIGSTTPAGGAFTTLSASSTVSGTGFSTYLASPPAIGGTAPAAGSFTTLTANGNATFSGLLTTGTIANSLCADSTGHLITQTTNCFTSGVGTVTSIATTAPLGGGTITTTGTLTCSTCVVASSPGVGIAHFAGATQTVTSSLVSLTADVTGNLPVTNLGSGTNADSNHFWRGDGTWGTAVTSVATTGPIGGGTITGAGTITCTTCSTNASALTSNLPVIGAGGNALAVGTRTGNTTQFATWTGATTAARCVDTDASGNLEVTSADCGAGGGGTISGLTVGFIPKATGSTALTANSAIDDGVTTAGTITSSEPIAAPSASFSGTCNAGTTGCFTLTNGTVPTSFTANSFMFFAPATITTGYGWKAPAAAATGIVRGDNSSLTVTISQSEISGDCTTSGSNAITCTKTNGVAFVASATTDTTNASNISSGTLGVAEGGSGAGTFTIHGVLIGQAAAAFHATTAGTSGQCLTSNGASLDPTFQTCGTGAGVSSFTGDGNIITNSASTGGVTTTIAGTSGGIPYFSSATAWKSSALLTNFGVVFGGGAGGAPTSSAQGAANMPLIGQGAANPIFSTIAYPTAMVSGAALCGTSTTAIAAGTLLAANALVFGGGAGACPGTGNGDFTYATHTLTAGAAGLVDFSAMTTTTGLKIPTGAGAVPTADGFIANNSTNHTFVWGSNGTTMVGAIAATGTGTVTTCTNQAITAVSSLAIPTCTTLTSSFLPATLVYNNQSNTYSAGTQDFTGSTNILVTTQASSDNSTKAASTAYVTTGIANAIAAVNPAVAVLAASTANLTGTYTQVGGGIGDTFTVTATGAFTLDGIAINTIGQRVLLKNQTTASQNGVYTATVVGTTGVSPVFTRALDYDTPSDVNNSGIVPVQSGTANLDTSWLLTSQVTSIGSSGSSLTYTQFSVNAATVVTSAAALTNNAVVIGGGGQASSTISADTTTTHALFATAGAPAFRAFAATDIPAALSSTTSVNGTTIPSGGVTLSQTVANGTSAMGTGAISSGACATTVTTTATGAATTDSIIYTPNVDPQGITGYKASATGSLYVWAYPTTNNVNFEVCNNTSSSITPGSALTFNWRVVR